MSRILHYVIVVDDCDLSPEELRASLDVSEEVRVNPGYYPKERHIIMEDRRYLPEVLYALDNLIGKE